jgi:hypothetical protein
MPFQRFFGPTARYVVFTDDPEKVKAWRVGQFEVYPLVISSSSSFYDPRITWRKWAPQPRLDIGAAEIRVDADIFLLDDPADIGRFCRGSSGFSLLCTQEAFIESWPYGNFGPRLSNPITPINAGLIGQSPGMDLAAELEAAYRWWQENVEVSQIKYHDEQGAVAYCMQGHIKQGNVMLLDPATHRVVCPLNDPPVENLAGLVLMHSTYPEHPAFWKFLPEIASVTGLPSALAP